MSLRETYQSRKNLLAANLTRQGVTASGDEGLTTLINKVLDISHGSTPTTLKTYINGVEVDNTQELPSTIISYADGEYVDYKFVVLDENDNPVQGYSIPLSVGGVEVSPTPVTDVNGEVNYRYVSGGVGDTNIYINCTLVSKTYEVQDIIKYDATEHTYTSVQIDTYPYQNQVYSLPSHYKMQFKLKNNTNYSGTGVLRLFLHPSTDTASTQPNNGFWLQIDGSTQSDGGTRNNGSTELNTSKVSTSVNSWVDMEMEVNGTSVTFKINGNSVGTVTKTWISNYSNWVIRLLFNTSTVNATYKDLKIIPL